MLLNAQSKPLSAYELKNDRIDIWEFPLDKLPDQAQLLLDEAELARAQRYHFARHQRRFTVARALVRLILSRYLQCTANQIIFAHNLHGKPRIEHAYAPQFNLSHSQELALLAVGQQFPMGIDLEFFSARAYEGIAAHLFSQQELDYFLKQPVYRKTHVFFHIWAQKEAFIKAIGLGLAYPTQLFSVPLFTASQELIADSVHSTEWFMTSFMPQVACSAALCYHPEIKEIRYIRLTDIASLFNLEIGD